MTKQETIKYLTDLMGVVQMAHFKGRLPGAFRVDEGDGASISLPLYREGDDIVDEGPQFRLADGDANQEPVRIYCVEYDPDDNEPLTLLAFFGDVCKEDFDIPVEQVPVEALEQIVKWIEDRLPAAEKPEPAANRKFDNQVTSFFYYMWNKWSEEECKVVFGKEDYWPHFWNKWCEAYDKMNGPRGAAELFYMMLSDTNRDKLVARALELYDGMTEK